VRQGNKSHFGFRPQSKEDEWKEKEEEEAGVGVASAWRRGICRSSPFAPFAVYWLPAVAAGAPTRIQNRFPEPRKRVWAQTTWHDLGPVPVGGKRCRYGYTYTCRAAELRPRCDVLE